MATENIKKEILLTLNLDTSGMQKESDTLKNNLQDVKKQMSDLNKEIGKKPLGSKEREELQNQYRNLERESKKYQERIKEVDRELGLNSKIVNENVGSNNQLRALLSKLTDELNDMGETEKETSDRGKFLTKTVRELSDTLKANESAVGDNRRNVGNYKGDLSELIMSLKEENVVLTQQTQQAQKQNKSMQDLFKTQKQLDSEVNDVTNSYKDYNQQITNNTQIIEHNTAVVAQNEQQIEELERRQIGFRQNQESIINGTKKYDNSLTGLNEKLKDLKNTLPTLDIGSDAFEKTNKAIKDTELKIGQVQGKVDEFGNKEPKNLVKKSYEDLAEATAGVVGGIQLVEMAFGKSNTTAEAQARILKLVAIQQAAVNVAKSVGAITDLKKQAIDKLATLQLKNFTAASIANAQATGTMSTAQKIYAGVVGKSTGAMKTFKVALAGTGIGALVILLSELIFNFDGVAKVVNKLTNGFDDFASKLANGSKTAKVAIYALAAILLSSIAPIILIIKLISDFEGTVKGLQNAVLGVAHEIESFTRDIPVLGDVVKFMVKTFENAVAAANKLATSLGLMGKKKFKTDIEQLTKLYEDFRYSIDQSQRSIKNQIALLEAQGGQTTKIYNLQKQLAQQNIKAAQDAFKVAEEIRIKIQQSNRKVTDEEQKLYDERKNNLEDSINDFKILEAERAKFLNEQARERRAIALDLENQLIEQRNGFINNEFTQRREAAELELKMQREEAKARIEELQREGLLSQKIRDQIENTVFLNELEYFKTLREIQQDELKKLEDKRREYYDNYEQQVKDSIAFRTMEVQKATIEELKLQEKLFVSTATNERERLAEFKQIQLQRLEIAKKGLEEELKLVVENAQKTANIFSNGVIDPVAQQQIDALKKQLRDLGIEIKKINQEGLISPEFASDFSKGVDLALQGINKISEAILASFAARQAELDKTLNKQIDTINKSTLTQLQKDEQIKNAQKKSEQEKYDLQVEAFEFQKAIDIANTIASTAVAIVNALALPPPFSYIQAAVIGATSAIQLGIIAAQQPPPPPFYEGGFTGVGNPREVSTQLGKKPYTYHKGEYVVPNKILKTEQGSKLVGVLESMRQNKVGSMGLVGMADGGFSASQINSSVQSALQVETLTKNIVKSIADIEIVTRVTDINRVNKNLKVAKVKSTI